MSGVSERGETEEALREPQKVIEGSRGVIAGPDREYRYRMEEALRTSEERYRGLLEAMPDGFVWVKTDRTIVEANRAFCAMTGYSLEEIRGMAYDDFTPEKWHRTEEEIIQQQVLTRGYSDPYEKEYVRKDGTIIQVELRAHRLKDEKGEPVEMWAFVRDMSRRKQRDRTLEESGEKFRLLFEKSTDAVLLIDDSAFVDCNEAALRLLRCSSKEKLIGLRPSQLAPERQPDGRLSSEKAQEIRISTVATGTSHFEWMVRAFDGSEFWTDVALTVVPIGGRLVMYTVLRDIGERKRAEVALRESEQRYRTVVELSPSGIFICVDDKIEFANRSFAAMTGAVEPENLYGKTMLDFVHPDCREFAMKRSRIIETERRPFGSRKRSL